MQYVACLFKISLDKTFKTTPITSATFSTYFELYFEVIWLTFKKI